MNSILDKTKCADDKLLLLSCADQCGRRHYVFQQHGIQNQTAKLSAEAHKDLQYSLAQSDDESETDDSEDQDPEVGTMEPKMTPVADPCKEPTALDPNSAKCSMDKSPKCKQLRERFLNIQGGLEDRVDELKASIDKLNKNCKETKDDLDSKITNMQQQLKDQESALTSGTEKLNNAEQASKKSSEELSVLMAEYKKWSEDCHRTYADCEAEECGLKKIRAELKELDKPGETPFFQDCVVGDWSPGECSATCAGGTMLLTREVTQPAGTAGVPCPPLNATTDCNQQHCPIDCVLEDWTGWSACSAECGGGVESRLRAVKVEPKHGGEPCGDDQETRQCNVGACEKECVLNDWSPWTNCSKACDVGSTERHRLILEPAEGGAKPCPDEGSIQMQNYAPCNVQACVSVNPVLACEAKVDVILALDGSGSIGSAGWDSTIKAAELLIQSFSSAKADVNLALILYSSWAKVSLKFTNKFDEAKKVLKEMKWPCRGTRTDRALDAARMILGLSRKDASTAVVVLTDGKPNRRWWAYWAAWGLKRAGARLMFVPVTRYAPLADIRTWVTQPVSDNIVPVDSFWELKQPKIVNHIIADVCPQVG